MFEFLINLLPESVQPWVHIWAYFAVTAVAALVIFVVSKTIYNALGYYNDADVKRSDEEVIRSRGFGFEEHNVVTDDGYHLVLHRVVNPYIKENNLPLKPVLMVHGMGGASTAWIMNDTDGLEQFDLNENVRLDRNRVGNTTAFAVANYGYDVWLANYRGTPHSLNHVKWSQDDPEYWDYTMDDIIAQDVPSFVDYVLKVTGKETLAYIGVSQGNSAMFGLLASRPEYNSKLRPFVAVTPVVVTPNTFSSVPVFVRHRIASLLITFLSRSNGNIFGHPSKFDGIVYVLTSHPFTWLTNYITKLGMIAAGGRYLNEKRFEFYASRKIGQFSKKSLVHTLQWHVSGKFTKFDHGRERNLQVYRQATPPLYDLKNVTNNTMVFVSSKNDTVINAKDVKKLEASLPVKLMENYIVPNDKWNHVDYHLGKDVGKYFNYKVIEVLRKVESLP